ncbi:HIRA-interacting protein 3 [Choloepus didactylus]|uniref:HIRA-interacting protein 3 n=1 Tax=Choloepus didactylus TaxID=27675 RepID=UPI0018A02A0F|nr:HIRA-interacting protein 3 [Choloepus didactylus]
MARESEMQEFTRSLFRGRPDLSTLTHSIVRRRFLAHAGRDHLEPEEKQALKRLVEEELLKMQVDEAGTREKLDLRKKVKRPPTPCSDPERKRFRFNSESEPNSTASSPECLGPPPKNGMAAAEVSSAEEESPRRASKKAIEESNDEDEQQRDPTAKAGLEKEVVKENSEEEEGSVRSNAWEEESSEEEEGKEEEEREEKGRTSKKTVTKKKQVPGKASASRKQAREETEDHEEEPAQRAGKKREGKQSAKSHQENKRESEEEEETPTKKKENREEEEEEEDWKPRARSNGGKRPSWEERSCQQKGRVGKLMGDLWRGIEKEATHSGDDSDGDEKPLVWRKSKEGTQCNSGKRQSGSSEEDGEDSWREGEPTAKGTRKAVKAGTVIDEESDLEREVSDSEAGGKAKEERKNRSSKKSYKKGRTRSSSSSSSDGSPEPKGGKADSGRHGEDHPAVVRLKRYIRACGAHRNYKKLLGSCRSHKERLSVLRAELEALGMKGNPSLEKCRALKEQREEAAEVASLDVANIISSSGRPRRRTAWNPSREAAPPGELYRRTLDSEEELPHPPPPDWSHMRGIISSDGESN